MEEKIREMLYDKVENPWEFVIKAAEKYKVEFNKTSMIGRAPSVDDVMGAYMLELAEGETAAAEEAEKKEEKTETPPEPASDV